MCVCVRIFVCIQYQDSNLSSKLHNVIVMEVMKNMESALKLYSSEYRFLLYPYSLWLAMTSHGFEKTEILLT